jgi:hypothetical protein
MTRISVVPLRPHPPTMMGEAEDVYFGLRQ